MEKSERVLGFNLVREVLNYYYHPRIKVGTDSYEVLRCSAPICWYFFKFYAHLVSKALSIHYISECQVVESTHALELWFPSIPDRFWAKIGKHGDRSINLKHYWYDGRLIYYSTHRLKELVSLVAPFSKSSHICPLELPQWIGDRLDDDHPEYPIRNSIPIEEIEPIRNQYDMICRGERFQGFRLTEHLMKVRFEGLSTVRYGRTKRYLRHFRGPFLKKPTSEPIFAPTPCSTLYTLDSETDLSIFYRLEVIIIHNTVEPMDLYNLLRMSRGKSSVIQLVYARIAEVDEGLLRELKKILSPSLKCIRGFWVPNSSISEIFSDEYHSIWRCKKNVIQSSSDILFKILIDAGCQYKYDGWDLSPIQILRMCNEHKLGYGTHYYDSD